jgi:hypothetical protein
MHLNVPLKAIGVNSEPRDTSQLPSRGQGPLSQLGVQDKIPIATARKETATQATPDSEGHLPQHQQHHLTL